MADQFCLRWNNFQSNIVSALDSLKCSEDLVDVTLTCDGRNIKAHKVILSACSPYFRNVFKENPCQHPVIILKDVPAEDIINLLSYMYQGEVFIEESKLSSFLHTAALLQVKGLTGVTQKESFASPNTSNKLYSQLTINKKEVRTYAPKKRRSSTSDKPCDVTFAENYKKTRTNDTNDIHNKIRNDNAILVPENHFERSDKNDQPAVVANGKSSHVNLPNNNTDSVPITIKTENTDDSNSSIQLPTLNSDNEDSLPDYENSMLARSLLQGKNASKNDTNSTKKVTNVSDLHQSRPKDISDSANLSTAKSPLKNSTNDEVLIKSERTSPKHDADYEPEVLLSEQQDGNGSVDFGQEQSQALMMLAGMSSVSVLGTGASTSQGSSHQSNHAAICGDCPHCGMKYSNQSALKYHVRLMHSDLTNRLCCYLCPRSFTMRETFKEHMWSSHGQRN